MKFKFRNLLIGTGIAVLGVAAVGAAVGITEKKSDKPDTSDTMTENLDLINLIGDLQTQIDSVSEENEKLSNKANQLTNSLNDLQTENDTLKNQLDAKSNELTNSLNDLQTENDTLKNQVNNISTDYTLVSVRMNGNVDGMLIDGEIFSAPIDCSFTLFYPYHVEPEDCEEPWELTQIEIIRSLNYCKYIDITPYSASGMDTYYLPTSFSVNKDDNMAIDLNFISCDGTKTRTFNIKNFNSFGETSITITQF